MRTDLRFRIIFPSWRSAFLLCAAATIAAPIEFAAAANLERPNILVIVPDQMRAQAMGAMGNVDVKTPNIDRLASEGVLFTNAYANTPLCCPARATLLTGLYPQQHGVICNDLRLAEDQGTLAEMLRDGLDYRTAFVGKWHLDGGVRQPGYIPPGPRRQGFEFFAAHSCSHRHFDNHYFLDTPEPIQMDDFETKVWTDLTIDFIERKDDRPFFALLEVGPPHNPYRAPPPYDTMYDPENIALRPNFEPGSITRKDIAQYYGMITEFDTQVGRLMEALERNGMTENTVVLFTSDHGDMLGSHGLTQKRVPYAESARIPAIIRYPARLEAGQTRETFFSHIDMPPTILGFTGMDVPSAMPGWNLAPLLRGITDAEPESILLQHFTIAGGGGVSGPYRAAVSKTHMFAMKSPEEPWLLFDRANDPYQLNNLVGATESAAVQSRMTALIDRLMREAKDDWSTNHYSVVEGGRRLYKSKAFVSIEEYLAYAKQHPDEIDGPGDAP